MNLWIREVLCTIVGQPLDNRKKLSLTIPRLGRGWRGLDLFLRPRRRFVAERSDFPLGEEPDEVDILR